MAAVRDFAENKDGLKLRYEIRGSGEPVERSLTVLADYLGADTILWATDYPHLDGFWGAAKMIKKMGMPPQTEAAVLAGGAKRLYNLH